MAQTGFSIRLCSQRRCAVKAACWRSASASRRSRDQTAAVPANEPMPAAIQPQAGPDPELESQIEAPISPAVAAAAPQSPSRVQNDDKRGIAPVDARTSAGKSGDLDISRFASSRSSATRCQIAVKNLSNTSANRVRALAKILRKNPFFTANLLCSPVRVGQLPGKIDGKSVFGRWSSEKYRAALELYSRVYKATDLQHPRPQC